MRLEPTGSSKPLVLHVISGLGTGGAEMMLFRLISNARRVRHAVVSLRGVGTIGPRIRRLGVEVHALDLQRTSRIMPALWQLSKLVKRMRPNIIQGWMTHGNVAATMAARLGHRPEALLWNVRQSLVDFKYERRATVAVLRLSSALSGKPDLILYNSRTGAEQHEAIGYPPRSRRFIPNGFDLVRLAAAAGRRQAMRSQLGLNHEVLIGLIARFHPMKNHEGFVRVAHQLAERVPEARFLLAGVDTDGPVVAKLIAEVGLADRFLALGERSDVPDLIQALDIGVSMSVHGEGFPNVVGEAMACGVPCLVTDVGDAAWVVGDTGQVVQPNDEEAAVAALQAMIDMGPDARRALGVRARRRMEEFFSITAVVDEYETLYLELCDRKG